MTDVFARISTAVHIKKLAITNCFDSMGFYFMYNVRGLCAADARAFGPLDGGSTISDPSTLVLLKL
jgi:hypothetical protein